MKNMLILAIVFGLAFCGGGETNAPAPLEQNVHDHEAEHQHEADVHDREAAHQPGEHNHEEGEHSTPKELRIPVETQKAWGIEVEEAQPQEVSARVMLPGVIDLNQNGTAHISSLVEGKIISVKADLGDKIRRGQTVVILNAPDFGKAKADFLEARARYLLSQKEYERAKMLFKEKAIEEREYLRREAEYQKLTTEYGARGSALHSYGLNHDQIDALIERCDTMENEQHKCEIANPDLDIPSPVSGSVIFRNAVLGEHVEPNRTLFSVSDLTTLWAHLDAYENDLPFIRPESEVRIISPLYPERTFRGKITYIGNTIDPQSRTIKVRVAVDNKDDLLKPNMYIQGIVENESEKSTLLSVPEEAVQNLEEKKIVFVQETSEEFVVRFVEIGQKIEQSRVITAGLTSGERIVVKGAFKLKTELSKATFGHAHVH